MCCRGFSGGGGSGTGNLSGTLTPPQLPVAAAPNTLIDSIASQPAGDTHILIEGSLAMEQDNPLPALLTQAGGGGFEVYYRFSRGTIAVPTSVGAGDLLGALRAYGYEGTVYYISSQIKLSAEGTIGAAMVPGRIEMETADAAGNMQSGLIIDSTQKVSVSKELFISKVTTRNIASLAIAAGLVAVDGMASDWFDLDMSANATLSNPTNPNAGRYFQIRARQSGAGSHTLAYGTAYRFPGNVAPVLSTVTGTTDYLAVEFNEVDVKWDYVGGALNFL